MAHIRDLLIPGTPCTQAYLSVEGRGFNVHTDHNTAGPTFYFILEPRKKNEKGGNLTLVQFVDGNPLMSVGMWPLDIEIGEVFSGSWDNWYHCNLPFDGEYRTVIVMYTHVFHITNNFTYYPLKEFVKEKIGL